MEYDIVLDAFNKTYNLGDTITGHLCIGSNERLVEFTSISIIMTVSYNL